MSKKAYLFISFIVMLSLISAGYAQGPLYLDFDRFDYIEIQDGFTSFLYPADNGKTINDIAIYVESTAAGGTVDSRHRNDPTVGPYQRIYRDFIFGLKPNGVKITLLGLGAGRQCQITIYSYDNSSGQTRSADWTANGTYLLTTAFNNAVLPTDANTYAFTGTAYADNLGTIVLVSSQNPASKPNDHFTFVNALIVIPQGEYVPIYYAHSPQPLIGQQSVPIDTALGWGSGELAVGHDVYFGTNFNDANDANRTNDPYGVLVSQGQSGITYNPPGLLQLNTAYYWRIDEVNDTNIWKGGIWNFTTLPYFFIEDFNSYATGDDLRENWKDNLTNGTSAFVLLESSIVRTGNSMTYIYNNHLPPHYSQVDANIADLGIDDPNWLGTGAQALVLYFHGDRFNPTSEQMYVSLTDGDIPPHTATVMYHSMLDITVEQWQKWNIPFTQFTGVNLANVARVSIGFGDGSGSGAGTVYFDNIMLDIETEEATEAAGNVIFNDVYQQLEGFGGAAVYEVPALTNHPKREEVYDLLFKELGLEILRIRNTYNYSYDPTNQELAATAIVVAEAREPNRSPNLKTELVPWSPPAYLKSNNSESGGGTIAKDVNGFFRYNDYAQWWYDSLLEFADHGVQPDYIAIQNEPFIETSYDSCRLFPTDWTPDVAAFNVAFETVWQKLHAEMGSNMPKMWAPETMGFWDMSFYIPEIIDMNHVDGFSHHLYTEGDYDEPDNMIPDLINYSATYGYKPLHMTEYVRLDTIPNFDMGMRFAWHIYNCLYYLRSTSFFNWTLFRGPPALGGIVTLSASDYIIRPQYWFLKGYTHFTGKDWTLIGTSVTGPGADNLRMSAFRSPDNTQLTIVILNKSKARTVITMPDYNPSNSAVYRSGQTLTWAYLGSFTPVMFLPPESITTISLAIPCLSSDAPEYADWVTWGMPDCWCFKRQCRGDSDGVKTSEKWVASPDLDLFKSSYLRPNTVLKNIVLNGVPGICADLDHKKTGASRVASPDLMIFKSYFDKPETSVPCCDADENCVLDSNDKYNFWTN